ncbi:Clavaminate synthase-like protein [Aaosphaeria arxii CBS 175.79]|uniref:Clavaminate synthase-like protein n=1 Tax=Aaosphaeria arxii CBS 175.79 TaxID=1450172 RepID=A0A6A5XNA6_9PLEO|nr:Clavaminate synthase-like protein [Aaosphaeria arxii CBS 175.79]KAF2014612.1 Clavaminate synthase-like protein [Aaosphaeria arxii CBS 175.79]
MPHSDRAQSPPQGAFPGLPPFPDDVPTAPLLRISLDKLLDHDPEEEERCWQACCDLGFFYLDLRASNGADSVGDITENKSSEDGNHPGEALLRDADQLFQVMNGFFDLDVKEKVKYDFADQGSYFGYKGYGEGIVDKEGTRDRNEFYNISKDDILNLTPALPSPEVLTTHRPLYASYINLSHTLCTTLLTLLTPRLPLTPTAKQSGGLPPLHALSSPSGDQIRFVRAPPQPPPTTTTTSQSSPIALGEHTDFGSITILFNRLGGLQVRLPPSISPVPPSTPSTSPSPLCQDGWTYVRPLPGHCIVNLGDALSILSSGILRSNIHRVVAPPGRQGEVTRWSLVYFCRPGDGVRMRGIVEGEEDGGEGEVETAKEWIIRRALGRRRVGGWEDSGGTEGRSMREKGGR